MCGSWFVLFGILTFTMIMGLISHESSGSIIIQLGVAGWTIVMLGYWGRVRAWIIESGPIVWLMPIFCMVTIFWSQEPMITFRSAGENIILTVVTILIARVVPPRNYIMILFLSLAIIAVLSVPFNTETVDGGTFQVYRSGVFANKNTFSTCSGILIISAIVILLDGQVKTWIRLLMLPFIVLGVKQSAEAGSVASSLGATLSCCWVIALFSARLVRARYRKAFTTNIIIGGLIVFTMVIVVAMGFTDQLLAMVGKNATLTGRTELWAYARNIIADNPWGLGTGYNAFWVQGYSWPEALWQKFGEVSGAGFSFHNLYYEMRVEMGLPGVVFAFITILATVVWSYKWVRDDTNSQSIFFFTSLIFILVIQTQGVDLFTPFSSLYSIFMALMLYSHNWGRLNETAMREARIASATQDRSSMISQN